MKFRTDLLQDSYVYYLYISYLEPLNLYIYARNINIYIYLWRIDPLLRGDSLNSAHFWATAR
jgi:hypothetical protein